MEHDIWDIELVRWFPNVLYGMLRTSEHVLGTIKHVLWMVCAQNMSYGPNNMFYAT